ncbi:MAG: right-handed parallel beta-helix repeat-containing protein [Planctomycetaceae bacterium]
MRCRVLGLLIFLCQSAACAAEYPVGPGEKLATPDRVPWDALKPGDTVDIQWRPEPYRSKFVLACRGKSDAPITVRGVPGPNGELPVLDGENAITPPTLNYLSGQRGVIKIGPAAFAPEIVPGHLVIENLEIRNARPGCFFASRQGLLEYSNAASSIYVERGDHVIVRNCVLHGCANGFFTAFESAEILLDGCHVYDNGLDGSIYQHNSYTESAGMIYQNNRFGPLRAGARGNNLKDRSAGLVIRCNWIEGGNRQLDLVDAEEGEAIKQDPRYDRAHVYGNVLIETAGSGNNQIVHFGGDNGPEETFRHGPLFFYNNTVISLRPDKTCLFRLSTNGVSARVFNNILLTTAADPSLLSIVDDTGLVELSRNVIRPGWRECHGDLTGLIRASGNIETNDRVVTDVAELDLRLFAGSPALDAGRETPKSYPVDRQFRAPHSSEPRPQSGPLDIGAFEFLP